MQFNRATKVFQQLTNGGRIILFRELSGRAQNQRMGLDFIPAFLKWYKPIIAVEQNLKDLRTSFPTGPLQSEPASIRKFSALRRWYKINTTQHDCVSLGSSKSTTSSGKSWCKCSWSCCQVSWNFGKKWESHRPMEWVDGANGSCLQQALLQKQITKNLLREWYVSLCPQNKNRNKAQQTRTKKLWGQAS